MSAVESRAAVLRAFGADSDVVDELLAYDPGELAATSLDPACQFPLATEPFVETWRAYQHKATAGGFASLADELVQLRFPIRSGISTSDVYCAATKRGIRPSDGDGGLELVSPQDCTIVIHPTWAGEIPIVQAARREDFVSLVRAFTARNEPVPIPDSMGACFVSGYNNWGRFASRREQWVRDHAGETFSISRIAHLKECYQDRFIILSDGPYSGVTSEEFGLTASEWRSLSMHIRREHECAHYWTRRVLGSVKKRLIDEVVADYCGIVAACGCFRADWFLAFFGLQQYPHCHESGRIHNYRGNPPLSAGAFAAVQALLFAAAGNLDAFSRRHADELSEDTGTLLALLTLSRLNLEELACARGSALLTGQLERWRSVADRSVRCVPPSYSLTSRG